MIGYKYFQENNFPWRFIHQVIVPHAMPHISPDLNNRQAHKILKKRNALLLRWDENFDKQKNGEWWHIIKDEAEDLSSLNKKTRYMIRKGSKLFEAKICDRNYIVAHGYQVYKAAYERYDTFEKMFSEQDFKSGILNLPDNTEFWGVFDKEDKRLVAFSENLVRDDACFYSTMWLEPEAMKKFAGYVLFHEMNKFYLNEKKLKYVSDGARSISHETNIHDFLQSKFAFRKAYSNLKVVYYPGLYPVIFCIYPFRHLFKNKSASVLKKISTLLEQERIRRACKIQLLRNT